MKSFGPIVLLTVLVFAVRHADATTILSNLPGTGTYKTTGYFLTTTSWEAVGVTKLGAAENFDSLTGMFCGGPGGILEGGIYSDVSGNPGVLLAAFNNVNVAAGSTPTSYAVTTASPFTLQPATSYWFVLHDLVPMQWVADNSTNGTTPTAGVGYTYSGYRKSSNTGSTWASDSPGNYTVQITTVPEPASATLLLVGVASGAATVRRRARR